MSDHYYDAGAGAWRAEDDDSWLDERPEDDTIEVPEGDDLPEPTPDARPREAVHRSEPPERRSKKLVDVEEKYDDPTDDPEFQRAARAQRELSGRVQNFGRRRGNHGTGMRGRGLRGMREGTRTKGKSHTVLSDDLKPVAPKVRPTGRNVGGLMRYPAPREGGSSATRKQYLFKLASDSDARRKLRQLVKQAHGITLGDVQKVTAIKGRPSKELVPLRAKVAAAFAATVDFEARDSQRGQGIAREALMIAYGLNEQQFDRLLHAGRESEGSKSKGV